MATEIRVQTWVQPGGRVEVTDPELQVGERVEVVIQSLERPEIPRRSILEILDETPGHLAFKSAEEVDAYIRELRDDWDR